MNVMYCQNLKKIFSVLGRSNNIYTNVYIHNEWDSMHTRKSNWFTWLLFNLSLVCWGLLNPTL